MCLAGFATDITAGLGRHCNEAMTFAAGMTGAGIIGGLAVIVSAAFVDAVTMNQVCLGNRAFPAILCITADITAGFRWHGNKTLALAAGMTCTGIVGGLAVIVPTTGIDTVTVDEVGLAP